MLPNKLLIIGDIVLIKINNDMYSHGVYFADFWQRYMYVFFNIEVLAQTVNSDKFESKYKISQTKGVSFIEIKRFSKWKYLLSFRELSNAISLRSESSHAIVRLPSIIGFLSIWHLRKKNINYFLEIVADPLTAYGKKPILSIFFSILMKYQISKAKGVSYVTRNALQERYPPSKNAIVETYSSISLKNNNLLKDYSELPKIIKFLHVSNVIGNKLKGHDIFLKTIKMLRDYGIDVHGTIVGDGPYLNKVKLMVSKYSLDNLIDLVGYISDEDDLNKLYYNSDVFLFPTRAEGLPRVLIHAMSIGLVAFSSNVGGISELLSPTQISRTNNPKEYVRKILVVVQDLNQLRSISARQIKKSEEYQDSILQSKRNAFYSELLNYY